MTTARQFRDKTRDLANTLGSMIDVATPDKTAWVLIMLQEDPEGKPFSCSVSNGEKKDQVELLSLQIDSLKLNLKDHG
jgi:hypothetical protein